MAEHASETGGPAPPSAVLGGRFEIEPGRPLPHLDSPLASAVKAKDQRAPERGLFALICRSDLAPRIEVIPVLTRLLRLPLINPIDAGTVAVGDGRRFVIVFEAPGGERMVPPAPGAKFEPLREDQLIRIVLRPLLPVLKELASRSLRHRAIRADNLFYSDARRKSVVLGECVSAPPGLGQPSLYEPIDGAMANPAGRGAGTHGDDLYALGVTLAVLLAGGNPTEGMSEDEMIEGKISSGSYATLIGQMRVSLSMMEPLRGLLCDDAAERWTVRDLEAWLGGRQLSPKQPMLPTRAARAIDFDGREIWNRVSLSFAMGRNWLEAGRLVRSGELEIWFRRSLADEETSEALRALRQEANASEDLLIARALILLSPHLPLRYRNFAARIEGVGAAFAIPFQDAEMRRTFAELMLAKLPQTYLQAQAESRSEQVMLMKAFDMASHFLERPQVGGGAERVLYEMARGWPCQSPLVGSDFVCEIQDLLPALERTAARGQATGEPVDPHVVAFCAARLKYLPEQIIRQLNDREDLASFRLGALQLLSEVQSATSSQARYPALGRWFGRLLSPVVASYHNRAYRERLAAEIERASGGGNLSELLFLVDSGSARAQDRDGFADAQRDYTKIVQAIAWLEQGGLSAPARVLRRSHGIATTLSAVISAVGIAVMTLIRVI